MTQILLIEDDRTLAVTLAFNLQKNDYQAVTARNGEAALKILKNSKNAQNPFSLILLDISLPDTDGFALYSRIREYTSEPVIFLTAHTLEDEILHGYDLGAEDYVTKPFSTEILLRKMEVVLRHRKQSRQLEIYDDGYLWICWESMQAQVQGRPISLSPLEFRALEYLTQNAGIVISRQRLLDALWDKDGIFVEEGSLSTLISRLRRKIETADHVYIQTIYGIGYEWKDKGNHTL